MSASDDFPRGIILSGGSGGGSLVGASVTFPASSGVAWTLTDVKIFGYVGAAGNQFFNPQVTANGVVIPLEFLLSLATVGNTYSDEWSGQIMFPLGFQLAVTYVNNDSHVQEYIFATAYPT
jgi:hypothetical protein